MKLQKLSLIAAAITLSFTATSCASKAQTSSSSPVAVEQAAKEDASQQHLGLTNEQKTKIKEIHHNTHAEIRKILTQDQQDKLKTAMKNHQDWQSSISSLNLSEAQKNQIQQVMSSEKTQIDGILTPEQQQQMEKFRERRHSQKQ